METVILGNKYKIVDTLYQSDLQSIYMAEGVGTAGQLLVNEVRDSSIIYSLKKVFTEEAKDYFKSLVDYFNQDASFYIVSSISANATLEEYLSSNSLRLSDKMILTESLLLQLSRLEAAGDPIKYHLLSLENISVAPNKAIGFHLHIKFHKESFFASSQDIIEKLGDVLCCIFANTPQGTLEKDKDSLPPTIAALIKRCKDGSYSSPEMLFKDFKASMLYATFVDNTSVDKQIMKNIQRAERKRSTKPFRRIAALLLLIALLSGGYFGLSSLIKHFPALRGAKQAVSQGAQIPVASFTMSKSKVYAGDSISFVSQSINPDIDDKISSYEWSVSRNGDMFILFSREANPSYTFDVEGDYVVSLIVKDSRGISSKAFTVDFKVYPRKEIPHAPATSGAGDGIRK
jgi:plastocyanin